MPEIKSLPLSHRFSHCLQREEALPPTAMDEVGDVHGRPQYLFYLNILYYFVLIFYHSITFIKSFRSLMYFIPYNKGSRISGMHDLSNAPFSRAAF